LGINGLLPNKMPDDFLKACEENKIRYPDWKNFATPQPEDRNGKI